jgi:hypothetical protein
MTRVLFLIGLNDTRAIQVRDTLGGNQLSFFWPGNTDFPVHLDFQGLKKEILPVLWFDETPKTLETPDLIVNCLNDPDTCSKSLAKAIGIVEEIRGRRPMMPIFNDPAKIAATARE